MLGGSGGIGTFAVQVFKDVSFNALLTVNISKDLQPLFFKFVVSALVYRTEHKPKLCAALMIRTNGAVSKDKAVVSM